MSDESEGGYDVVQRRKEQEETFDTDDEEDEEDERLEREAKQQSKKRSAISPSLIPRFRMRSPRNDRLSTASSAPPMSAHSRVARRPSGSTTRSSRISSSTTKTQKSSSRRRRKMTKMHGRKRWMTRMKTTRTQRSTAKITRACVRQRAGRRRLRGRPTRSAGGSHPRR